MIKEQRISKILEELRGSFNTGQALSEETAKILEKVMGKQQQKQQEVMI